MAETDISTFGVKACKSCGETKALSAFLKSRVCVTDGHVGTCRDCMNAKRRERIACDPIARAKQNDRARRCKAKVSRDVMRERKRREAKARAEAKGGIYHGAEGIAAYHEARRLETLARTEKAKQDRAAERDRAQAAKILEKPWLKPGLTSAEAWRLRYRHDEGFNMRERIRTALRHERNGIKIAELLRSAIRRRGSSPKAQALLGYSIDDLKRHIERQFKRGMDWPTFLTGAIHIDHIVPLARFDLTQEDEVIAAWSLTNLRPMWAQANIAKGCNLDVML